MPAPVNDVLPVITGVVAVGQALSCSQGEWTTTGSTLYAYQWASSADRITFANIAGAVSPDYVPARADIGKVFHCTVTATNNQGNAGAVSENTDAVPAFGFFTVEDGTGLVEANSYGSVAEADAYHALRNNTTWLTATTSAKETALVDATDYIELRWSARFKGERQFPDNPQNLSFPRLYIDANDTVPLNVKRACAEYALRALSGKLAPDASYESNGQTISKKRTKVGPIETDLTYTQGGTGAMAPTFRPYPAADAWLRPYLLPSGGNRVIR